MNTKPAKQWTCIECGAPVGRKVKRCKSCNQAFLRVRGAYERTPEHRAKMSEAQKGKPKPALQGRKRPTVAKKIAAAWTAEMRAAARERGKRSAADREWLQRIAQSVSGERNPMWQGGISGERYAPGFSKSLKARIRLRDNHTCQLCGATESELGYRLSIHHADYDKTNHDDDNLFSTCKRCNSLVNTNRDIWPGYFAALAHARSQFRQDVGDLIGRKVIAQHEGIISVSHDGGPDLRALFAGRVRREPGPG